MRITKHKDFWAGALCVGFGIFFSGVATHYPFGTADDMGPGYFPTVLGLILCGLGLLISAAGLSAKAMPDPVTAFEWKVLFLILGPVVLFGLLLEPLGLVLSIIALVLCASMASREFSLKVALLNAVLLLVVSVAIFVWALNLQFDLWPNLRAL